jgi:NAD(P)-dependent dehydrogenase (short-subunit alcohol dehydrogenase family)
VEKTGRTAVTTQADVRIASELRTALEDGIAILGRLDIVVAQAGVMGAEGKPAMQAWSDVINTNLVGSINAIQESLPHLTVGASIIAIGSTSAMMDFVEEGQPGKQSRR